MADHMKLTRICAGLAVFLLVALLVPGRVIAQRAWVARYAHQADIRVYEVAYPYQADLKVYLLPYPSRAGDQPGWWSISKYAHQADLKIFFVPYAHQADLRICYVAYPHQAGCTDRSGPESSWLKELLARSSR